MRLEDVIALARAGFTADQIRALAAAPAAPTAPAAPAAQTAPAAPVAPAAQTAPAAPVAPVAPPVSVVSAAPAADQISALLGQMQQLTQAVHANALLGAQQPKQETADDIIAAIIAPPRSETGNK